VTGPLLAYGLAAAACVAVAGTGLRLLLVPAFEVPVFVRVTVATPPGSVIDRLFDRIGRPLLPLLRLVTGDRSRRNLQSRLDAAGGLNGTTVDRFLARRAGGLAVGGVIAVSYVLSGRAMIGVLLGAVLVLRADYALRGAGARRQAEIERTLPDLLDVLGVTVLAGASFRVGMARVAQALPGALADELTTTLRQMDVGIPRRQAFEQLRDRNPSPGLRRFVAGVLQAEELGSSLSGVLDDLAVDMRKTFAQEARKRADSMDKSIALVTTTVLLPAMILLVLSVFFGGISGG
jgi:tight adherence protein C